MPIKIEREDTEELKKWGNSIAEAIEQCIFCGEGTRYWHRKTNKPVCESCAKTHKTGDIRTAYFVTGD